MGTNLIYISKILYVNPVYILKEKISEMLDWEVASEIVAIISELVLVGSTRAE